METGWSSEDPVRDLTRTLTGTMRKTAARLVHEWLLAVRGEVDVPDIAPALSLADIYECHACVEHIGQVYVKGIMEARGGRFGVREVIDVYEAAAIAARAADPAKRLFVPGMAQAPGK
ncbi:MAG: hypothetical protein J5532_01340 [Lachnospiraceae bacterium]|nr:hypothetical protein [Lachnospiraceae bacterium]